jgi:hypothetical protein
MQSPSRTQQKRSTKIVKTSKEIKKSPAPLVRTQAVVPQKAKPKVVAKAPVRVIQKKASASITRKLKRYAKQSIKSTLLSPVFHTAFKVAVSVVFISVLGYSSYFFISKTFANEVIVSQSEIVARVAKLTTLPDEAPYDIVRVQDETDLRKQNDFYKDIKEGDYILVYKNMAVIYDLRNNQILAIKRSEVK